MSVHRLMWGGLLSLVLLTGSLWGQETQRAEAIDSVRELSQKLENGQLQDRRDAAWGLAEYGEAAAEAVGALAVATADRDPQVSNGALQALGRIGPAAEAALPEIFAQLSNRDAQRRYRAAFAFGRCAAADNPLYEEGLRDRSANLRAATAEAVGWTTTPSESLMDRVGALLEDDDPEVVTAAVGALQRLGQAAIPALSRSLQSEAIVRQVRAAEALTRIGAAAASTAPQLVRLSQSSDPAVRAAAVAALGKVAADDHAAQAAVAAALNDGDSSVVMAAMTSVIRFGRDASSTIPQLVNKINADPEVANMAAVALGRLGAVATAGCPRRLKEDHAGQSGCHCQHHQWHWTGRHPGHSGGRGRGALDDRAGGRDHWSNGPAGRLVASP